MNANQFQVNEYLNYVHHLKDIKRESKHERKCQDAQCKWDKRVYRNALYTLSQTQLVHVMFYHTNEYNEIAHAVRKDRFTQYVTPGVNDEPQEEEKMNQSKLKTTIMSVNLTINANICRIYCQNAEHLK